jgi:hypothetical protein
MLQNVVRPLLEVAKGLQHVDLMQVQGPARDRLYVTGGARCTDYVHPVARIGCRASWCSHCG